MPETPSRLRVSLAGGGWRDIEADNHELAGGILVFTLNGALVLMVPFHALIAVEPISTDA